MIDVLLWTACLAVSLPMLMLAAECVVGSLSRCDPRKGGNPPPFVVLMPAHDEALGIARSVRNVVAQLRARDALIVIADNCIDDTAAIARSAGATVITRCDPERRGKGYAIEFGRAFVESNPAQIIIIVDADCSPAPHALRRLAGTAAKRHAVVQGAYLLMPPAHASGIVRVSCFAFLIKNLVRQLGLRSLAGAALLQGSGMAFPSSIFRRLAWSSTSLVEDLELGVRLLTMGERVLFDEAAYFFSEASSQRGTASQRRRWEHGVLQSMTSLVPALLRAGCAGRPRLWLVAMDLLIPPTALLLLAGAGMSAFLVLAVGSELPVLVLLSSGFAAAGGLIAAWFAHGRRMLPLRSLADLPRYLIWKLPILAQFLTKRERQWLRTEREQ